MSAPMTTARRRRGHRGPRQVLARTLVYLLLGVLALTILYPLLWMFLSGMKTNTQIFSDPWAMPDGIRLDNFVTAWRQGIVKYLANSAMVTAATVVLALTLGCAASYALTKLRVPGATAITFAILAGLMISPTSALVPLFRLLQAIGLYDTTAGLVVLYVAYKLPFTIFLIRAYMTTLPRDIEDAARVDGANQLQVFLRIIVPLCKPVLVSAGLVLALYAWNEFPFALIFIQDPELKTLPVGLLSLKSAVQTDWAVLFAGLALAALPMMVAFLSGQRHFIRGLAEGAGK